MGAEATVTPAAVPAPADGPAQPRSPAVLQNVLVLAGRGATGLLPVVITVIASRTYDVAVMGQIVTAVAVAYAIGEVADGQSQRHVTRLLASHAAASARAGPDASLPPQPRSEAVPEAAHALAAFNALRFAMLAIGLAAMLAVPFFHHPALFAVLLTAVWGTVSNVQYARALADGRFDVLAFGPFVPLVLLLGLAGLLAMTTPVQSPWTLALMLHGARAAEVVVLCWKVPWPGLSLDRAALRGQWISTRYLLLQTAMSAAHVRLLIPVVLFFGGAATAGIFWIGLSLLSVLSLVAVAVTIPAYRRGVTGATGGAAATIGLMIRRTSRDLAAGVAVCGMIGALFAWGTPVLLRTVFKNDDPAAHDIVRLIALGGLFEAPQMFAGAYYQAAFKDRLLFGLSVVNVVSGWVLLILGLMWGGPIGGAWGFVLSRTVSALVLWIPLLVVQARARNGLK